VHFAAQKEHRIFLDFSTAETKLPIWTPATGSTGHRDLFIAGLLDLKIDDSGSGPHVIFG
jgi:hypothetical protein